jgi:hypothetical protein
LRRHERAEEALPRAKTPIRVHLFLLDPPSARPPAALSRTKNGDRIGHSETLC